MRWAGAGNLLAVHIIVLERLKEASMRIRKITFTETAVALAFGLAVLFWWEVAEPIRSTGWRGSAEQWLALGRYWCMRNACGSRRRALCPFQDATAG